MRVECPHSGDASIIGYEPDRIKLSALLANHTIIVNFAEDETVRLQTEINYDCHPFISMGGISGLCKPTEV